MHTKDAIERDGGDRQKDNDQQRTQGVEARLE
jgi:hypothetical protein